MIKFPIYTKERTFVLNLPEDIDEINEDYLTELTNCVHIADHYALVGIVYREKLTNIILAKSQKKQQVNAQIIPIIVKCGKTDNEFIQNAKCKQIIGISSTQLGLGLHVTIPSNSLSFEKFLRYTDMDTKNTYNRALSDYAQAKVCFVDFKIVPISDIQALYDKVERADDPYVEVLPPLQVQAEA